MKVTQSGTSTTVTFGIGESITIDGGVLTLHRPLRKTATYDLHKYQCAGMTCEIRTVHDRFGTRDIDLWRLHLWSDSRTSEVLFGGSGPQIDHFNHAKLLDLTDDDLSQTSIGEVVLLLDQAISVAPGLSFPPHTLVGSYYPAGLADSAIWIPRLGLGVSDAGTRHPTVVEEWVPKSGPDDPR